VNYVEIKKNKTNYNSHEKVLNVKSILSIQVSRHVKNVPGWAAYRPPPILLPFPLWGWRPTQPIIGLLYQPQMMMDNDECAVAGGMLGRGNRNTSRKPSPSAALSTTNLT
jgi:hypothetical protein